MCSVVLAAETSVLFLSLVLKESMHCNQWVIPFPGFLQLWVLGCWNFGLCFVVVMQWLFCADIQFSVGTEESLMPV
jgi:hypothetical protein